MVCERFIGSNRLQEGGFLGTHKKDFEAHRKGCDWRHEADHIDMNPIIPAYPGLNVQETLELIALGMSGEQGLENVLAVNNNAGPYDMDMNMNFIHEVQNPVLPQDAATKWYVDQLLGVNTWKEVLTEGNFSGGVDVNINQGSKIINSDVGGGFTVTLTDNPTGYCSPFTFNGADGYSGSGFLFLGGSATNGVGGSFGLIAGGSTTIGGTVNIRGGDGATFGGTVTIQSGSGATAGDIILNSGVPLRWPHADGTAGQTIVTDGAGNLSFGDMGGGENLYETLLIGNWGGNLDMTDLGNVYLNSNKSVGIGTTSPTANAFQITGGNNPSLVLEETTSYGFKIEDTNSTTVNITKNSAGNSEISISPLTSAAGSGYVSIGRSTTTSGSSGLLVYKGNGSSTTNHRLLGGSTGNGHAYLAENSGNLVLGGSSNTYANITFSNTGTYIVPNQIDSSLVGSLSNLTQNTPGAFYSSSLGPDQIGRSIYHGWGTLVETSDHIAPVHSTASFLVSYVSSQAFSITLPASSLYSVYLQQGAFPATIYYAKIHVVHNSVGSAFNASYSGTATWFWNGSSFNSLLTANHQSGFFGSVSSPSGATPTLTFTPPSSGIHSLRWLIEIELTAAYSYGP